MTAGPEPPPPEPRSFLALFRGSLIVTAGGTVAVALAFGAYSLYVWLGE